VNQPELIDVFLAFCRGLCLSFDFSVKEGNHICAEFTTDPETQYLLGNIYQSGKFLPKNLAKACECYAKAAEQGNAMAQHFLGQMSMTGGGVCQDKKKAFEWYAKAAENGISPAQYNLGVMFQNGIGIHQDDTLACEWYAKAAEQGNAMAQYNLALMYMYGEEAIKDKKKAVDWCLKSAHQGNAMAQQFLGDIYCNGMGVDVDMDQAQDWYTKAEEHEEVSEPCVFGNSHIELQDLAQNKIIAEFPFISTNSNFVPEFCVYSPSTEDMDRHQFAFYKQLEHRLNNGEYLDIQGNMSYVFIYLYKLISLWDDIGLNDVRQQLIHISELYKSEEKLTLYCLFWANDCLLGLKKYEEYLECTKPQNLYGNGYTKNISSLRLNIQKHINLEADAVDILLLTGGSKSKFIGSNQLLYKEKLKTVFALFAEKNGSWFNILHNWISHKNPYHYGLFRGAPIPIYKALEFKVLNYRTCNDHFAEIKTLSKEAVTHAKKAMVPKFTI
jgi:hypothetical protein